MQRLPTLADRAENMWTEQGNTSKHHGEVFYTPVYLWMECLARLTGDLR